MQNKKILSTLIIALLAFSMIFAFIPMASAAIGAPTLTPDIGNVGDKIKVNGTGASLGGLVEVFWETTAPEKLLNTTYATGAGYYECYVTIPTDVKGDHYIIVKDVASTNATIFAINPKITLTPTSGIPGDSVAVAGTGFAATSNITILFYNTTYSKDVTPALMNSSALGSFSTTFVVPTVDYGNYTVEAKDAVPNSATETFVVGAAITLTPKEGPTGTVVTIAGRGFTKTADLAVTIKVGVITAKQVALITTKADGTFTGQFIVPTVAVGTPTVNATDAEGVSATATFTVTGTTWIGLTPTAGQPGWSVTIEGANFTAIANTPVTVKFGVLAVEPTFYTNATGGFKGTFNVPAFPEETYTVNATDANDLSATKDFKVAITLIFLTPTEGPTGTEVTITGYGFTAGGTANVTISDKLVKTGIIVLSNKTFTATFIVPTLPAATYTVTAVDSGGLSYSANFKVTKSTELILTPSSAPAGYEVSIEGKYFTAKASISVTVWFYNTTWYNATSLSFLTFSDGVFNGTFIVPDADLGGYTINATDANDLYAEASFSIVTVTVEMHTRSLEYLQGDTISFYIKCTFNYNMTITIKDPTKYPAATVSILEADWETMDSWKVVPYEHTTFTLPSDAVLGTWNWTATIGIEATETDTFTVVARPTLGTIVDLITGPDGVLARIDTAKGEILVELADIDARIISIEGSIATIETDVGTIKTDIATINLKVVAINGTVATIKTDLGTMQGTVTSIDGNVATIKTDVGIIKADVSDIVEKGVAVDLTPVWIAVVFSILAFLAAIVTVYMLRSKLA